MIATAKAVILRLALTLPPKAAASQTAIPLQGLRFHTRLVRKHGSRTPDMGDGKGCSVRCRN